MFEIFEKVRKILVALGWIRTHAHGYTDHYVRRLSDLDYIIWHLNLENL